MSSKWGWSDVQPELRFALKVDCEACGAKEGELCFKNNGSLRRRPHGPRRGKPDRDWPGKRGSRTQHPFSRA